jgi:putative ABC transport system permease protein
VKIIDTVKRSGRNLGSAKVRTLLTALAIAVGAFALNITLAAGNGLHAYTDKLIASNFDPAELIVGRDREVGRNGPPQSSPQEYDTSVTSISTGGQGSMQVKQVTRPDINELKKLPYIEQVRENYQINIQYVTRPGQKKYTGSVEVFNPAQKPETAAGTLPKTGDLPPGKILLPETYLSVLGFADAQAAVGQKVLISAQQAFSLNNAQSLIQAVQAGKLDPNTVKPVDKTFTYTVEGVTKKSAASLQFTALPIIAGHEGAQQLYDYTTKGTPGYDKFLFVYARVKNGTNESTLQNAQSDLKAKGYFVQSSKDLQQAITQFVNILQIMVGVFGFITIVASVFGIVNTQYISVLERTREIGLMKALGMRRKDVSRLFLLEAAWIGLMGGIIGTLGGVLLGLSINPLITSKLKLGDGTSLIVYKPVQIAVLILALVLIAMVAGYLPARKAAKLDPIEALRTE